MTPNGKIDLQALPEPELNERTLTEYVAPGNEIETNLVSIWEQLLRRERIGIHDNFFEIGGNSLLGVKLLARIREQLGLSINVLEILQNPTIASLGSILNHQSSLNKRILQLNDTQITKPNIFFIPPILGSSILFFELAAQFGRRL